MRSLKDNDMVDSWAKCERLELAGKAETEFVNSFFILFNTARLVEVSNATYQAQSAKFYEHFAILADSAGAVSLKLIGGRIVVNDRLVRFDRDGMILARRVMDLWQKLGIGAIMIDKESQSREIDKFIYFITNAERKYDDSREVARRLADLGINGIRLMEQDQTGRIEISDEERPSMRHAARAVFFKAISTVEEVMAQALDDKAADLSVARRVVHSMIERISDDESMMIELTQIRDFDEYTYAHCANVCIYALTLGIRLGLGRRHLSQLGFSALFHDIGKIRLPEDLIRKPDVFDENDWRQMQKHPILGAKTILRNFRFDIHSARAALVAFEHHINNDYTGYPALVNRRPTNLFSRIVSIADTFDALSSGRVYMKKLISPDEALRKMLHQMRTKFDAFLLKLFVNIIGIYPAGTLVLLSDDRLALVSRTNQGNLSRPVVRLIGDRDGLFERFTDLDLTQPENGDKKISKIINPSRYNIDIRKLILSD